MKRKFAIFDAVKTSSTSHLWNLSNLEQFTVNEITKYGQEINPFSPNIKIQILLSCHHTFLTEEVRRNC